MVRRVGLMAALFAALTAAAPAWADYAAGQRAWEADRFVEAISEWEAAAAEGDRRAMVTLGRIYRRGIGTPQDYIMAHMWLNLAAGLGDTQAAAERDALARQMTVQEHGEARKLARAWRAANKTSAKVEAPTSQSREARDDSGPPPARVIQEAQSLLTALGYDPGTADGKWGRRSVRAYQFFLRDAGLPLTRELTPEALRTMRTIAARRSQPAETAVSDRAASEPATSAASQPSFPRDALHRIVQAGDIDGLNAALQAGADVNARDRNGWTALMHAANKGYTLMVPSLLDAKANVDSRAADGATALFMAVLQGHGEIVTMLVRAGADISIRGPRGRTPLDIAQLQNLERITKFLKRADADRAAYSAAVKADTAERYVRYITSYPDGLFIQEAKQRRRTAQDREAFQSAQTVNTARSHRRYLEENPTGKYRETAEQRVIDLDRQEYNRAEKLNSAAAYANYIAANPHGHYVAVAKRNKKRALDREMFVQAKSRRTIRALQAYLDEHPEGEYRVQAQALLKDLRNPVHFAKAQETHTIEAYENYLMAYPDGEHADEAKKEIAKLSVIGKEFRDCTNCPAMVVVPPGSFMMGSSRGKSDEQPRRRVSIPELFAVGKYEVTVKEFGEFIKATGHDMAEETGFLGLPAAGACAARSIATVFEEITWRKPGFSQEDRSPAVCINWNDAAAYAKWLSTKTGMPYRLLSEAEWEYAARATTKTIFSFGDIASSDQANYDSSHNDFLSADTLARGKTLEVGSFPPNKFGLHDLHGNAFEWVEDCWHKNYKKAPTDNRAWTQGGNCSTRVIRGGSWFNHAGFMRSTNRSRAKIDSRYTHYGLRVAREVDPVELQARVK